MLPTRLRQNETIRALVRETRLDSRDFVYPIFVTREEGDEDIKSMPGQQRISVDNLGDYVECLRDNFGVRAVLLFGIPESKDSEGSGAYAPGGVVQEAINIVKEKSPDMTVITDVCLCEYKDDGHCCFFYPDGRIDRERTLEALAKTALSHAQNGADIVAPSDMMDGHTRMIRERLDAEGYEHVPIMGYSAKYASAFYGPFREAADSAPAFGDRRSYQMDPANADEALREIDLDIAEGADIVMVKPAMSYLDIISKARSRGYPLAAYQVSGEYSMLKTAVDQGLLDESAIYESLLAIKRAGADIIISYFTPEVPRLIEKYQT